MEKSIKVLTPDEVRKLSPGMSGYILGIRPPDFDLVEVMQFLYVNGFDVIEHRCEKKQEVRQYDNNGDCYASEYVDAMNTFVIAIRPGHSLPKDMNGDNCAKFHFVSVFYRELKRKLLGIK